MLKQVKHSMHPINSPKEFKCAHDRGFVGNMAALSLLVNSMVLLSTVLLCAQLILNSSTVLQALMLPSTLILYACFSASVIDYLAYTLTRLFTDAYLIISIPRIIRQRHHKQAVTFMTFETERYAIAQLTRIVSSERMAENCLEQYAQGEQAERRLLDIVSNQLSNAPTAENTHEINRLEGLLTDINFKKHFVSKRTVNLTYQLLSVLLCLSICYLTLPIILNQITINLGQSSLWLINFATKPFLFLTVYNTSRLFAYHLAQTIRTRGGHLSNTLAITQTSQMLKNTEIKQANGILSDIGNKAIFVILLTCSLQFLISPSLAQLIMCLGLGQFMVQKIQRALFKFSPHPKAIVAGCVCLALAMPAICLMSSFINYWIQCVLLSQLTTSVYMTALYPVSLGCQAGTLASTWCYLCAEVFQSSPSILRKLVLLDELADDSSQSVVDQQHTNTLPAQQLTQNEKEDDIIHPREIKYPLMGVCERDLETMEGLDTHV